MESSSFERYAWRETENGRWEREVDEVEHLYTSLAKAYRGSGRVFFAMTGHISFSVAWQDEATQQEIEHK